MGDDLFRISIALTFWWPWTVNIISYWHKLESSAFESTFSSLTIWLQTHSYQYFAGHHCFRETWHFDLDFHSTLNKTFDLEQKIRPWTEHFDLDQCIWISRHIFSWSCFRYEMFILSILITCIGASQRFWTEVQLIDVGTITVLVKGMKW